ncbi:MAG: hypothetical protein JW818_15655 [Pirellulales bacterium]|nr:hypothetical protein [Pirellulales bacterium]
MYRRSRDSESGILLSNRSWRRKPDKSQNRGRHDRFARRLRCEPLEDRRMLAVLMVDADAPAGGDGLSWATAYDDLQPALEQASTLNADADPANDIDSIWIAEGTYFPSAELEPGNVRSASFSLVDGVTLFGGFAGSETTLEERDWSAHLVTLSGDLGTLNAISDNAYTVVYCGENVEAGLNGLTITGGNANGSLHPSHPARRSGSGIFSTGALTIYECTISGNSADQFGGGIYKESGTLVISDSTLSGNAADTGGGIYQTSGTLTATNCVIFDNAADTNGGGIFNTIATLTVTNCSIASNVIFGSLTGAGGGILNDNGILTVTNSTVWKNFGRGCGGIHSYGSSASTTLCNTIVATNAYWDIRNLYGTFSGFNNLIGDGSGQIFIDGVNGNQVGTHVDQLDPELDARGIPLPDSPTINAGSNELAVDAQGSPLIVDQNGLPRILYGTVDIGAYEFRLPADANLDGHVDAADAGVLGAHWLTRDNPTWEDGDFNADGCVDDLDASILAANWGARAVPPLPGDASDDGTVNAVDARILADHWLMPEGAEWKDGDFNDDGRVDDLDASILAANWGAGTEGNGETSPVIPPAVETGPPLASRLVGPVQASLIPIPQRTTNLLPREGIVREGQGIEATTSLPLAEETAIDIAIREEYGPQACPLIPEAWWLGRPHATSQRTRKLEKYCPLSPKQLVPEMLLTNDHPDV